MTAEECHPSILGFEDFIFSPINILFKCLVHSRRQLLSWLSGLQMLIICTMFPNNEHIIKLLSVSFGLLRLVWVRHTMQSLNSNSWLPTKFVLIMKCSNYKMF